MRTPVRARQYYKHLIFIIMQYAVETITPAKAREYFNTSRGEGKRNRPINESYVHSYADTMKRGRWRENGDPIQFDWNGDLLNGCHRMLAVEEAGIPVRFLVVRGLDPEVFTSYDNGRHRTVGQLLCMQGVKNYNLIGAIININERLIMYGRIASNNSSRKRTNDDNYRNYQRDPKGFDDVANYINKLQARARILSGSWAGGLIYYLTHAGGYSEDEVKPFFEGVFSTDTTCVPAANVLRKRITEAAFGGKKFETEMLFALIVKAWNAYITGRELKTLAYNANKELEYPRLILKGDKRWQNKI